MTVSVSHAVELNDVAATNVVAKDVTSTVIDDTRLAQLDLDSYNPDNDTGLDLYLDVTLNGASAGLVHFVYREDQLWASPAILQQLGFILPPDTIEPIPLSSLLDVKINYDARRQTVSIIAPLNLLNLDTTIRSTRSNKRPKPTASPGMLLNYDLYGTQTENNATSLSAYTELRAFNSLGVISSTALTTGNRLLTAAITAVTGTVVRYGWIPAGANHSLTSCLRFVRATSSQARCHGHVPRA